MFRNILILNLMVVCFLQYAFNLFSHNAPITENGYNEEEMKLVKETRKIWNDTEVKVTVTCIRVPVMRAHAESVNLQFENPLDEVVLIHIKPVLLLNLLFNSYFDALDSSIWYQRY
ncbi:unnamed protein product [Brassica napus]|uniref:(rape) hypothetical protein n=1 Tax=Brassica napus TaxID=3708 RepID=A0A816KT75_BRANA|nr:unnamed protein product [Brassica napus]